MTMLCVKYKKRSYDQLLGYCKHIKPNNPIPLKSVAGSLPWKPSSFHCGLIRDVSFSDGIMWSHSYSKPTLLMDLIHNDIIIDKMAVLVVGLRHVLIRSNQNELFRTFCGFHNIEPWKYKRLVSVMWCEIIQPGETRPKFWYGHKTACICLVSMHTPCCSI